MHLPAGHPLQAGRTSASPVMRATRGEAIDRHPVWFMRQAGRSLPEYRKVREGIAMLDSSEIPRQHLMAGSVIATIPIMVLFLGLERFMTKGLASGSVKG